MSGSAQNQITQVEDLLRDFGATHAVPTVEASNTSRFWHVGGRPVIAASFAFFIFAPGCAAATVFLMRADGNIPPVIAPDRNPPIVAKADRLPLDQWGSEAAEGLGAKDATRFATASALADPAFLSPVLIRGSIEDGTLTTFADPAPAPEAALSPSKSRSKRDARHSRPTRLVAELPPPPEPSPPTFLEKLFGTRFN